MNWDTDLQMLVASTLRHAPFLFIILLVAFILYRAHCDKDSTFSIYHLVTDTVTGRGSIEKVGMLTAQITVTWWFMDKAAKGGATMEDVAVYGGLLGLARLADKFIAAKYPSKGDAQ